MDMTIIGTSVQLNRSMSKDRITSPYWKMNVLAMDGKVREDFSRTDTSAIQVLHLPPTRSRKLPNLVFTAG